MYYAMTDRLRVSSESSLKDAPGASPNAPRTKQKPNKQQPSERSVSSKKLARHVRILKATCRTINSIYNSNPSNANPNPENPIRSKNGPAGKLALFRDENMEAVGLGSGSPLSSPEAISSEMVASVEWLGRSAGDISLPDLHSQVAYHIVIASTFTRVITQKLLTPRTNPHITNSAKQSTLASVSPSSPTVVAPISTTSTPNASLAPVAPIPSTSTPIATLCPPNQSLKMTYNTQVVNLCALGLGSIRALGVWVRRWVSGGGSNGKSLRGLRHANAYLNSSRQLAKHIVEGGVDILESIKASGKGDHGLDVFFKCLELCVLVAMEVYITSACASIKRIPQDSQWRLMVDWVSSDGVVSTLRRNSSESLTSLVQTLTFCLPTVTNPELVRSLLSHVVWLLNPFKSDSKTEIGSKQNPNPQDEHAYERLLLSIADLSQHALESCLHIQTPTYPNTSSATPERAESSRHLPWITQTEKLSESPGPCSAVELFALVGAYLASSKTLRAQHTKNRIQSTLLQALQQTSSPTSSLNPTSLSMDQLDHRHNNQQQNQRQQQNQNLQQKRHRQIRMLRQTALAWTKLLSSKHLPHLNTSQRRQCIDLLLAVLDGATDASPLMEPAFKDSFMESNLKCSIEESKSKSSFEESKLKSSIEEPKLKSSFEDSKFKSSFLESKFKASSTDPKVKGLEEASMESGVKEASVESGVRESSMGSESKESSESRVKEASIETRGGTRGEESRIKESSVDSNLKKSSTDSRAKESRRNSVTYVETWLGSPCFEALPMVVKALANLTCNQLQSTSTPKSGQPQSRSQMIFMRVLGCMREAGIKAGRVGMAVRAMRTVHTTPSSLTDFDNANEDLKGQRGEDGERGLERQREQERKREREVFISGLERIQRALFMCVCVYLHTMVNGEDFGKASTVQDKKEGKKIKGENRLLEVEKRVGREEVLSRARVSVVERAMALEVLSHVEFARTPYEPFARLVDRLIGDGSHETDGLTCRMFLDTYLNLTPEPAVQRFVNSATAKTFEEHSKVGVARMGYDPFANEARGFFLMYPLLRWAQLGMMEFADVWKIGIGIALTYSHSHTKMVASRSHGLMQASLKTLLTRSHGGQNDDLYSSSAAKLVPFYVTRTLQTFPATVTADEVGGIFATLLKCWRHHPDQDHQDYQNHHLETKTSPQSPSKNEFQGEVSDMTGTHTQLLPLLIVYCLRNVSNCMVQLLQDAQRSAAFQAIRNPTSTFQASSPLGTSTYSATERVGSTSGYNACAPASTELGSNKPGFVTGSKSGSKVSKPGSNKPGSTLGSKAISSNSSTVVLSEAASTQQESGFENNTDENRNEEGLREMGVEGAKSAGLEFCEKVAGLVSIYFEVMQSLPLQYAKNLLATFGRVFVFTVLTEEDGIGSNSRLECFNRTVRDNLVAQVELHLVSHFLNLT
ncbi:hypothetical protein AAMO2058_001060700 [Amorphochlora amoebiformis]